NFGSLFGLVIAISTRYSQPLLGLLMCVFAGWVLHRNALIDQITRHDPKAVSGAFATIWPGYVRFVCPALIVIVFAQTLFG
ncbi:MAG: sodium-dependent transporter, partial [Pseudomonadota bacterium]